MGNIEVGDKSPVRSPGQPIVERLARPDGAPERRIEAPNTVRTGRSINSGAMSQQQCGNIGNYSTPQKFVRLVGCRDAKAGGAGPWVRPKPAKP